ncbi:hypothetical protein DPM19_31995 [Actinomadura craniellae]|uniref:Uncharacterized protein n=1 Tax=Actinomadura craniellae TaxID=2231787 RepID=A0A365GWJ8_9ACTN|nr:hypothetical protein DPM19_31995 [Actinomadura craniellae]
MRHVFGFILGVLLTPALAYGAAWGHTRATDSFDPLDQTISDSTRLYGAFAVMAAVGLVLGVIIVARWASPLASLIPALVLIAWSVYFFADPGQALDLSTRVPPDGEVDTGLRLLLGSGVFALMGVALLMPAWAPGRWRRGEREDSGYDY